MKKKRTGFILLMLLLFCLGLGQTYAAACGDVNSSGSAEIVDAFMIAQL